MATEIIFPRVDMDMAAGRIGRWLVDEGAPVKAGEPLFEIETDKAAMEIEAPASGVVRGVKAADGAEVEVGAAIGWIVADGEAWEGQGSALDGVPFAQAQGPTLGAAPPDPPDFSDGFQRRSPLAGSSREADRWAELQPLRATPLARREAKRRGLDLASVRGSGPNGRIVSGDLAVVPASPGVHRQWFGVRSGTPVVLLHGFGADLSTWCHVWPLLQAHRILAIDLPGHGRSVVPGQARLEALVDAVQSVLDEEGVSRLHLVGHSLGGAVALALAAAGTVELRSLVLLAPAGLGPEINGDFLRGFARAEQEASLAPWLCQLFADQSHVTPSFVRAVLRTRADPALREYQRALIDALFPDGVQAHSWRCALDHVSVPTKVVWGTGDRVIPARHGRGLPGRVGLHVIACGHQPQVEAPALVAFLIAEAVAAGSQV